MFEDQTPTDKVPIERPAEAAALAAKVREKMARLVEDFATGQINRSQFHELYGRYQRRIAHLAQLSSDELPAAAEDGEDTLILKKRLTARVLGVSIYANSTGLPIETLGEFRVDSALIVPMLSSYRDATREIFKAGMRSTVMENGTWLCFVGGNLSTLIALYSVEPSTAQLSTLESMHRDFETANKAALEKGNADPSMLAYPFLTFIREAKTRSDALKTSTTQMPPPAPKA